MEHEVKPHIVYTTLEAQKYLKVSESTIKRFLKRGLIRANKVGGQYRILGKEIIRLVSPKFEKEVAKSYMGLKNKATNTINKW